MMTAIFFFPTFFRKDLLVGPRRIEASDGRTDGSYTDHFLWRIYLGFGIRRCDRFLICMQSCMMAVLDMNIVLRDRY
jgi:hypothetical protein